MALLKFYKNITKLLLSTYSNCTLGFATMHIVCCKRESEAEK